VCGRRVIIPNEGFKDPYRGKQKKKENLTRINNIYTYYYIYVYIIMRLPGGATMRAMWAGCGSGGGNGGRGWHSNVTTHINGSLGRVIDTKLFRTHLSRRPRLQTYCTRRGGIQSELVR